MTAFTETRKINQRLALLLQRSEGELHDSRSRTSGFAAGIAAAERVKKAIADMRQSLQS